MKIRFTKLLAAISIFVTICVAATGCSLFIPALSAPAGSETASASSITQSTDEVSSAVSSQATTSSSESAPSSVASMPSVESSTALSASNATFTTSSQPSVISGRPGIADVIDAISDSVVAINVTGVTYDYFNREYPTEGSGSGVIITSDGYIVTNNHVVTGGTSITVFLHNGVSYPATLIGKSSANDIALLKINATGLSAAKIGSSSTLRVGDATIVIGNPLGELQGTVTTGIISGLEREIALDSSTMKLLQTDAAVNPGNSGGGIFDYNGELIGIVVAKTSDTDVEGLGYAIPIDDVTPVVNQLRTYGYVTGRPYVGLTCVDITSALSARMNGVAYTGVYVSETESGSPAALAGLQTADLILKIDGKDISTSAEVNSIISGKSVGDTMTFYIFRLTGRSGTEGQNYEITVTVAENKD